MARVDFYRLTRDPVERVLPALATRVLANGDRLLVVAAPAMQRQAMDEALWTLNPASFLPHGHAGSPDEEIEPILIAARWTHRRPTGPATSRSPTANGARKRWASIALSFCLTTAASTTPARSGARLPRATMSTTASGNRTKNGRWSEGP